MRHDLLVQAVDWEIRLHCPNKEQNDNTHRLPFAFFFEETTNNNSRPLRSQQKWRTPPGYPLNTPRGDNNSAYV